MKRTRVIDPNSLLLEVKDASQLLGCTEKKLRGRVARRTIPFRKDGKRILFVREELLQFIRSLPGCSIEEAELNLEVRKS